MKPLIPLCTALVGFAVGMWSTDSIVAPASQSPSIATATSEQRTPERPDALAEVLTALRMKPGLRQFAALSEPMSHLSPEQIGKLIERSERELRAGSDHHSGWLFKWWMDRDPAAAAAWFQPRLRMLAQEGSDFSFSSDSNTEMIGAWARKYPDDALALAREFPRSGLVSSLIYSVIEQKKALPDSELWSLICQFPEGKGRVKPSERFLSKWAKKDAATAFAAVAALAQGPTRDAALIAVLPELAATDAKLAFEQYNKFGLNDPKLVTKIIAGAASKDPVGIADWLTQLDPVQFTQSAPWLVDQWAAKDPAAAFAWATTHRVPLNVRGDQLGDIEISHSGFQRSFGHRASNDGMNALATAMDKQPAATLAWLHALPAGPERDRMTSRLLSAAKPEQAIKLFDELPPEARRDGAYTVVSKLYTNPKSATDWAESLPNGPVRERAWFALGQSEGTKSDPPAGPDRDALLSGRIVRYSSNTDPINALNMSLEISNPAKRREALDGIMERQTLVSETFGWAAKSREWLEKANVPDDWKAKWRLKSRNSAP